MSELASSSIGTPNAPTIIDVRNDEDLAADPRLIPGSVRRDYRKVTDWTEDLARPSVVLCQKGQKLGHGVSAHPRAVGKPSEVLEGGFEAWRASKTRLYPKRNYRLVTVAAGRFWVTRSRPKIDGIACPWLISRFVDPLAVFLFVPAAEVAAVADRFNATPFDIEEVHWSHRGEVCTFDVMVEEFRLGTESMIRLATMVRGADTPRPELAPEVAGLLAASLGSGLR